MIEWVDKNWLIIFACGAAVVIALWYTVIRHFLRSILEDDDSDWLNPLDFLADC